MLQAVYLCCYFGDCPIWKIPGLDAIGDDLGIQDEKLIALTERVFSCVGFVVLRQLIPDCLEFICAVHQTGGQLSQNVHMPPVFWVVIDIYKAETGFAKASLRT